MKRITFLIGLILLSGLAIKAQDKTTVLSGGRIHVGNGKVIEKGVIGFKNGLITFVGEAGSLRLNPDEATILDVSGNDVYPGIIGLCNTLGLVEIEAVRATRDAQDVGGFTPHVRSLIAFNPESRIIPTIRSNGVLTVQASPQGGVFSGTSSLFNLDGWNWEDAVLKTDDGIHFNFPEWFNKSGWWAEPGGTERNKEYDNQLAEIKKFLKEAKAYTAAPQREVNIRFEAMKGVFDGSKRLYIYADYVKELQEVIQLIEEHGIKKPVIVGGKDASFVIASLKKWQIPVILNRLHDLPERSDSHIDEAYKQATLLQNEGILYSINYSGGMEAMGLRNLPFVAGTAAAYGITREQALSAITLNAAKITGADHLIGSLETGKQATLFVSKGDALDMMTHQVTHLFLKGKSVSTDNHQSDLYKKYSEKLQLPIK